MDRDKPGRVRGVSARMVASARALRRRETEAEAVLWDALRDRRLAGLKFRRQQPAGPFVLDFYCPQHALAVEVDGGIHAAQADQDAYRTDYLAAHGIRLLRVGNEAVLADLAGVLETILGMAAASPSPLPPPSPLARGEGGGDSRSEAGVGEVAPAATIERTPSPPPSPDRSREREGVRGRVRK